MAWGPPPFGDAYGAASAATKPAPGVPIPVMESKPAAVSRATFWCVQLPVPLQKTSLPS